MARGPAGTVGALIDGALVPVMPETMAGVACLVIAWVGGGKGDLRMSSSPPGLDSLEDALFIGYQERRGGRMLEEEEARVERAVTKEEKESGELRRESSNMYLSISSKNSSMPS